MTDSLKPFSGCYSHSWATFKHGYQRHVKVSNSHNFLTLTSCVRTGDKDGVITNEHKDGMIVHIQPKTWSEYVYTKFMKTDSVWKCTKYHFLNEELWCRSEYTPLIRTISIGDGSTNRVLKITAHGILGITNEESYEKVPDSECNDL